MKRIKTIYAGLLLITILSFVTGYSILVKQKSVPAEKILASLDKADQYTPIFISYPQNETRFPPEIIAPTFVWQDESENTDMWLLHLVFDDGKPPIDAFVQHPKWEPTEEEWQDIKVRSLEHHVRLSLFGFNSRNFKSIHSKGDLIFLTSKDSVGAPIFYREVNLPFESAVKDPSKILWRFGCISDEQQPPVVLEKMPVCGNCHSFSLEGRMMGLDVDYANDKGSYAFTAIQQTITLSEDNIITWSDYKRNDHVNTFGLLSQVSPDGRYVISTVKDRSVFVPKSDLAFSQLFFPIKGILAYYDRATQEFYSLPGADNPDYVQSNASWSPDGRFIVFAKSRAYKLKNLDNNDKVLLTAEECEEFLRGEKEFLFDLYRIPFNGGRGGMPEPLQGASRNGMSNFFAKYSPDGKWIVFCKAKSYMLLQPDSELYIIPAEGGEARRMRCNTQRMNSWHSWSPNSKWLVFSSKQNSAYTQLFLTHIDSLGFSSPPVLLKQFTSVTMAANIPEFVYVEPAAIKTIEKNFITDNSYLRAGNEALISKDLSLAEQKYKKALHLNPNNLDATIQLAVVLAAQKKLDEAEHYCYKAIQLDSANVNALVQLGEVLCAKGNFQDGIEYLNKAISINNEFATAYYVLGQAREQLGEIAEAIDHFKDFVRLYPKSFKGYFCLIELLLQQGDRRQAIKYAAKAESLKKENSSFALGNLFTTYNRLDQANIYYKKAIKADPENPEPICNLAANYFKQGELESAINCYNKALYLKQDVLPGLIGLASILVMSPNPALRDGERAVELATRACELTHFQSEVPLDLLAAAYSECGRYQEAIINAERALTVAQAKQKREMCAQIGERIEYYKSKLQL
ncbi:tetratricopeptide repeat protein [candidate division KSB1 bacterium]|nr:tetratricopeptide repeat protein [candidate division KSB1 bacterium]